IRRVVREVWVLVVGRGRDRLATVQVFFRRENDEVEAYRSYQLFFRPAKGNGQVGVRQPGRLYSSSIRHPDAAKVGVPFGRDDLRDRAEAGWVQNFLENFPQDMINKALAEGHPLP